MRRVLLIHSNAAEAKDRAAYLREAGCDVTHQLPRGLGFLREVRRNPPNVVVIDLDRLPSVGRDVGLALRMSKSTRLVPLVFAGGVPEKVAGIRALLPDASFTPWPRIRGELKRAAARRPADPVVPRSIFEPYKGTPLPHKLGIVEASCVGLIGAPEDFEATLGRLPRGATLLKSAGTLGRNATLFMWFVRSSKQLNGRIAKFAAGLGARSMWVAWPKASSGVASDLSQIVVRRAGLANGLVDYKVCAIDDAWSGLLFKRRDAARSRK
ncbi:MAG TPA: hypothetical protein VEU51_17460 [Candidatus Acidoferrales bacterium]|nr:hypothetical protein [Candidatus Acidoferrales bacterium]